ncbi:hypothetical protein ACQPYK_25315 [Streptosporangium sp. CA-135522]|uniref:hypothetical protein n=1 Tax=Streptosporangium sp. CA-135522 TaxID=3240072 RepID=UPI003D8E2385
MTQPTLHPAYGPLAALLAEMRPDWDLDQVIRELIGCPWSHRLVVESVLAARDEQGSRLHVRDAIVKIPSQAQPATPEQVAAYRAHAQRILDRRHTGDDQ